MHRHKEETKLVEDGRRYLQRFLYLVCISEYTTASEIACAWQISSDSTVFLLCYKRALAISYDHNHEKI